MSCDHCPVNREDNGRWIPVNAVAMRGADPTALNHRIERVSSLSVRAGVELAILEGAEDDPGRRAVVNAKADVLPWGTGEGRDKLQRVSRTIHSNSAGQRSVNHQVPACDRSRAAIEPGSREPIRW